MNTCVAWRFVTIQSAARPRGAAAATVAYDTFGPGDTSDSNFLYSVDGAATFRAFHFVPAVTGTLELITVALGRSDAAQATTVFELYTAPTNLVPGVLVESLVVENNVAPNGASRHPCGGGVPVGRDTHCSRPGRGTA